MTKLTLDENEYEIDDMTDDTIREAKGRYIMKGEKFFHIPYKEAELVTLNSLTNSQESV